MSGLKSSYEIALEKMKEMEVDEVIKLTEEDKINISNIKNEYEAKIAEKKILLVNEPELNDELSFLVRKRDEKINEYYENIKKVR
jgi:hypothetical protein